MTKSGVNIAMEERLKRTPADFMEHFPDLPDEAKFEDDFSVPTQLRTLLPRSALVALLAVITGMLALAFVDEGSQTKPRPDGSEASENARISVRSDTLDATHLVEVLMNQLAAARPELGAEGTQSHQVNDDAAAFRKVAETVTAAQDERKQTTTLINATGHEPDAVAVQFGKAQSKAVELRKTDEVSTAALQEERKRSASLTNELAAVRRNLDAMVSQSSKTDEELTDLRRTAQETTAALQDERKRSASLATDLAAVRSDLDARMAQLSMTGEDLAELRKSAETANAALQDERKRAASLLSDLAVVRRDLDTKIVQSSKAGAQTDELKKSSEATTAALQEERTRTALLVNELAAARREIDTKAEQFRKAGEDAAELRKVGEAAADALRQERERNASLTADLASVRRELDLKASQASNVTDDTANWKSNAEASAAALQEERRKIAALNAELAGAREAATKAADAVVQQKEHPFSTTPEFTETTKAPAASPSTQPAQAVQNPEIAHLVERADSFLDRGDINSARSFLQRAVELGGAKASFRMAETYDPRVLTRWNVYGTRADTSKAREYYAKALAAGIPEAKAPLDSLPQ